VPRAQREGQYPAFPIRHPFPHSVYENLGSSRSLNMVRHPASLSLMSEDNPCPNYYLRPPPLRFLDNTLVPLHICYRVLLNLYFKLIHTRHFSPVPYQERQYVF
jgi:hypothetical protein